MSLLWEFTMDIIFILSSILSLKFIEQSFEYIPLYVIEIRKIEQTISNPFAKLSFFLLTSVMLYSFTGISLVIALNITSLNF